ncbi:MAG: DNA-3-methyladenine glycosylase family protein [Solirubrobacteraceae bacterium]
MSLTRAPEAPRAGRSRALAGRSRDSALRELRVEVAPAAPFRLPLRNGMDGVLKCKGGVLERLLHHEGEPVRVRVAQTAHDRVLFGALSASEKAAAHGIERMRFALGLDDDLAGFYREFEHDPLIGRSIKRRPWLRTMRRPEPFEALAWAICEQLIEFERAAAIQRRIVARLGPCWAGDGRERALRDVPSAQTIADTAPALLESFDLSGSRARLLVRVAREVAGGRLDLHDPDHERGWLRLRAMPGIGPWTVEMLALGGQGRHDQMPAGDLSFVKWVGRRLSGGDPHARANEDQVREFFAPYGAWAGLAAVHALRV